QRVFRAAARAHLVTGVPITTHTSAAMKGGSEQQDFLQAEGVSLENVIIGHCGDSEDLDYLRAIMDRGSTIGMDRFGLDNYLSTEKRVATVVSLCAEGYADRVTLSHDAGIFSINTAPAFRARTLPDWRYSFVPSTI